MAEPVSISTELAQVASEDRVVLLDLARVGSLPVVLEGTAAAIWHALVRRGEVDAVVQHLADDLGVGVDVLRPDVDAFVAQLRDLGLVRGG